MTKYINLTVILSSLLLTTLHSNAADHQSANIQKALVGTFIGIATYTGWLLCKSFKNTPPKPVHGGRSEPRFENTDFMIPAIRTPKESVITYGQDRQYELVGGGWILDVTPEQERIIN